MEEKFITFLEKYGYKTTTLILAAILIFFFINIDKVILLKSEIYGLFAKTSSFAKKKQISHKIRGTILKSAKEYSLNEGNIVPADLKVTWVNNENMDSFVNNNQVIVRIKQSSNPHENLILAVSEYINHGLLYNVKRYLDKDVMDASRILMTRKIVQVSNKSSLTYLEENYIFPRMKEDHEIKELYENLVRIDNNGMFVDILLNEYNKAGMTIYNQIEDPELIAESKEFMRYLYNIAIKLSNDVSDLCFNRDYFKVAIVLAASDWVLKKKGIAPFLDGISQKLDEGIRTIYIFGLGKKIETATRISEEIESDLRIDKIKKHSYKHINEKGIRIQGVFYECEIFKDKETAD